MDPKKSHRGGLSSRQGKYSEMCALLQGTSSRLLSSIVGSVSHAPWLHQCSWAAQVRFLGKFGTLSFSKTYGEVVLETKTSFDNISNIFGFTVDGSRIHNSVLLKDCICVNSYIPFQFVLIFFFKIPLNSIPFCFFQCLYSLSLLFYLLVIIAFFWFKGSLSFSCNLPSSSLIPAAKGVVVYKCKVTAVKRKRKPMICCQIAWIVFCQKAASFIGLKTSLNPMKPFVKMD